MTDHGHNCAHEVEQERIEQAQREAHEAENCEGPPRCGYCVDMQEMGEQALGG